MFNSYGYPNPQMNADMMNQRQYSPYQPIQPTQNIQPIQQINTQPVLLGKSVDSIDVVKAMDIPLDGRISYFPLMDGSAIVTKQLQNDGTSKTVIYKPVEEDKKESVKYVTFDDLKKSIQEIDMSDIEDLKDELKNIKKQLKDIKDNK